MNIFLANEQKLEVDEKRLTDLARHTLESEGVEDEAELSVLLITSDHIRRLNSRFAGDDYATDVLAFPMMDAQDDGPVVLGDVVICPEVAENNAQKLGHQFPTELDTLLVHGTLHLLGYDHQNAIERDRMDRRIRDVLTGFGTSHA